MDILARYGIKCPSFILDVGIEISPEFNKEESILRSFVVQLLETTLFLWKLVIDLAYIHRLKIFKPRNP